jgi:NAD(P)H-flavin reductase
MDVGSVDPLLVPNVHEVIEVINEIPEVVTLRSAPVTGRPPEFLPAQVSMVGAFGIGEAAISISSPATVRDYHDYTIRRAGAITSALTRLRAGDHFWVRGPFGAPWDLGLDGRDVIIGAGGIGLAPLRSAVYAILDQRERLGSATLVVGARTSRLLLYASEYQGWRDRGLDVVTTIDAAEPSWIGAVGFVPPIVDQIVGERDIDPTNTAALLCGPDVMMRLTADALVARGTPADRIQLTLERNMQCGIGLCGHCQLGPIIVCRDGPVARYSVVARSLRIAGL